MNSRTRTLTIATATALLAGGSAIAIAPAAQAKTVPSGESYWSTQAGSTVEWPTAIAVKRNGKKLVIANPLASCFKGKRTKGAKFRGGSEGNSGIYTNQTRKLKVKQRVLRMDGRNYYRVSPANITGSNATTWLSSC